MNEGKLSGNIFSRTVEKNIKRKCKYQLNKEKWTYGTDNNRVIVSCSDNGPFSFFSAAIKTGMVGRKGCGIYMSVSIIFPLGTKEEEIKDYVKEMDKSAELLGVLIKNIDISLSRSVVAPIILSNALVFGDNHPTYSGTDIKKTDSLSIISVGDIGLSGMYSVLDNEDVKSKISQRYNSYFIRKCSVRLEDFVPSEIPCEDLMCERFISAEGGISKTLWDMSERLGCGFDVDYTKIPVRQEHIEVCELLGIDIYNLHSLGNMLIITDNAEIVLSKAEELNLKADVIGKLTKEKKKIICGFDTESCMNRPKEDEIYKFM